MASNSILANMSVVLGANVAEFQKGMNLAAKELKGFQRLGDSMKDLGSNMSKWISAPLAGLAAVSVKTFGDIEALKKGLQAVAGSAEGAEKQFTELKKVAKLPGLGLEEAVKGAIRLQSIGISAEQAQKSLQVFGNAVATVGGGRVELERAIYGLQQLANTDFPLGEDLNILKDAIPQITPLLKEAFGTARSEELKALGITSKQVVDTITNGLAKLPPVSGGVKNSFENLSDSAKLAFANIGEAINRNLNVEGFLNALADRLTSLAEGFSRLNPGIQKFIVITAALAAAIGPLLVVFGAVLTAIPSMVAGYTALSLASSKLWKQTARLAAAYGPLLIQVAAIGAAVAGLVLIAKSVYDSWSVIGTFFEQLWAKIQLSFANALLNIVKGINNFGSTFGIEFKNAEASLQRLANTAKATLDAKPYVSLGDAVSAVGQAMTDNLNAGMAAVKRFFFSGADAATTGAETINQAQEAIKNKASGLTSEQQKALDALVKGWNDATKKAQVYGAEYDIIGEKTRLLTMAIDTLIENGLAPQSKIIQQLKRDLDAFKNAATSAMLTANMTPAPLVIPARLELLPVDMTSFHSALSETEEAFAQWATNIRAMFEGLIVDSVIGLGTAIASAVNGVGIKQALNGFLLVIVDWASTFGKYLIGAGIAALELGKLIAVGPAAAPAAIAAGVALVALAGIAKNQLSKGPAFNGPSAPRSASPRYSNPGGSGYGEGRVIFEISGDKLQGVLSREDYRKQRFW